MLLKQKHPSLLRNLVLGTFGKLLIVFSTMVNLLYIPPLFNDPEVLSSASDKAKLFAENLSKNSNHADSGISFSLPISLPCRGCSALHWGNPNLKKWFLSCIFKIMRMEASNYLINLILKCETDTQTRNNSFPTYNCWIDCFKYSFFRSTLGDWFRLDINIKNLESVSLFKGR